MYFRVLGFNAASGAKLNQSVKAFTPQPWHARYDIISLSHSWHYQH